MDLLEWKLYDYMKKKERKKGLGVGAAADAEFWFPSRESGLELEWHQGKQGKMNIDLKKESWLLMIDKYSN